MLSSIENLIESVKNINKLYSSEISSLNSTVEAKDLEISTLKDHITALKEAHNHKLHNLTVKLEQKRIKYQTKIDKMHSLT